MKGSIAQPKVFISYSWASPQHERWVLDLAERLSEDGIVVVLDKWDLKEGQDKHTFMEQMVHDESITKVLVICESTYQTKADDRKGGVGTETQLISKEVYDNTAQEKFVPIVREHDLTGKPCIPHYMASRIYIDLSTDDNFEENYQRLVRNLYGKPLLKKPPLGIAPAYITEDEQIVMKTSHRVNEIKRALLSGNRSASGLIAEFLDTFIASLRDFRLTGGSAPDFDDRVADTIQRMLPLRDDFIELTFAVFKFQDSVDLDVFHGFFEQLLAFLYRPESVTTWTEVDFDNYRVFAYELMLNFVAALLQLKKYKEAGYFANSQYFYRHNNANELAHNGIEMFNMSARSLDEFRNKRLKLNRVSLTADLIKTHSTRKDITFEEIKQADLILYYITELNGSRFAWFPRTSVYSSRGSGVELFDRMVSLQHFEKIKKLFDVENSEELKKRVEEYVQENKNQQHRYSGMWNYSIRPLETVIEPGQGRNSEIARP
jgi:hypothetical protein